MSWWISRLIFHLEIKFLTTLICALNRLFRNLIILIIRSKGSWEIDKKTKWEQFFETPCISQWRDSISLIGRYHNMEPLLEPFWRFVQHIDCKINQECPLTKTWTTAFIAATRAKSRRRACFSKWERENTNLHKYSIISICQTGVKYWYWVSTKIVQKISEAWYYIW